MTDEASARSPVVSSVPPRRNFLICLYPKSIQFPQYEFIYARNKSIMQVLILKQGEYFVSKNSCNFWRRIGSGSQPGHALAFELQHPDGVCRGNWQPAAGHRPSDQHFRTKNLARVPDYQQGIRASRDNPFLAGCVHSGLSSGF